MLWNIKADKKGERPLFKNNKVDPIAIDCIVCLDYRRSLEPNINALKEMKEGVYLKWFRKQITFYQKHLKAKHGGNIIAEIQKAVNS